MRPRRFYDLTTERELKQLYLQREGTRILRDDARKQRKPLPTPKRPEPEPIPPNRKWAPLSSLKAISEVKTDARRFPRIAKATTMTKLTEAKTTMKNDTEETQVFHGAPEPRYYGTVVENPTAEEWAEAVHNYYGDPDALRVARRWDDELSLFTSEKFDVVKPGEAYTAEQAESEIKSGMRDAV
jgi:hypothetical protein